MPRLMEEILQQDEPLAQFWSNEKAWFGELKDLRDDILHRTAFDKKRSATFPDVIDVLRATGGQPHFVGGTTLARYLGEVLVRVFSLACLADDFVTISITARHPEARLPLRRGILLSADEMELSANDKVSRFGLGTPLYSMDGGEQSALEFFMNAGEDLG